MAILKYNFLRRVTSGLFFALLVSLMFSCNDTKIVSGDVQTIEFTEHNDKPLASYFSKYQCVQLEINDECIIPKINKIEDVDGTLVILTDDDQVLAFSKKDGKFLNKIGNKGEGPKEYVKAYNMYIKDDKVNVVDNLSEKIITYSLKGEYISSNGLRGVLGIPTDFEPFADDKLLVSLKMSDNDPVSEYAYGILNVKAKNYEKYFEKFAPIYTDGYMAPFAHKSMSRCDDHITFFKVFNDTLFHFDNEGNIIPRYKLDLKKYRMPTKKQVASLGPYFYEQLLDMAKNNGFLSGFDKIFETKDMIHLNTLMSYMIEGYYWIDKTSGQGFVVKGSPDVDDEVNKVVRGETIVYIIGADDNEMISQFDNVAINCLKRVFEKNPSVKAFYPGLKAVVEKADPEGNPLLIFYEH